MRHEMYDRNGNLIDVAEVPDIVPRLAPIDIVGLFTESELAIIDGSTSSKVVMFRTTLFAATNAIALNDKRITDAIALFQALNILTPDRAAKILSGQTP